MPVVLDIYVDQHCNNCEIARDLAQEVRLRMPHVVVRLQEMHAQTALPESVFAAPTYLLNGKRIALGNPSLADLLRQLDN